MSGKAGWVLSDKVPSQLTPSFPFRCTQDRGWGAGLGKGRDGFSASHARDASWGLECELEGVLTW